MKHNRNEFNKFKDIVISRYEKIGIKFEYIINYPKQLISPNEQIDQYATFSYWTFSKLKNFQDLEILDLGSPRQTNLINSVHNNVTAIVLRKPIDGISNVNWVEQDASDDFVFNKNSFDVFTSPSSLHLIGQGRYSDKKDPEALLSFIEKLDHCMKKNSKLFLLMPMGKDQLLYGYHFIYSFESIKKIFKKWKLKEFLVDERIIFCRNKKTRKKNLFFSQDTDTHTFGPGDYKLIYLYFEKN